MSFYLLQIYDRLSSMAVQWEDISHMWSRYAYVYDSSKNHSYDLRIILKSTKFGLYIIFGFKEIIRYR